jgi:hypothetical protein
MTIGIYCLNNAKRECVRINSTHSFLKRKLLNSILFKFGLKVFDISSQKTALRLALEHRHMSDQNLAHKDLH